jgi:general stress protein YciG
MEGKMDNVPALRKALRGFAAMSPEKQLEIARKGGASVPAEKRSFAVNRELAREAGTKGGSAAARRVE